MSQLDDLLSGGLQSSNSYFDGFTGARAVDASADARSKLSAYFRVRRIASRELKMNFLQRLFYRAWMKPLDRLAYVVRECPRDGHVSLLFVKRKQKALQYRCDNCPDVLRIHLVSPGLRAEVIDGNLIEISRGPA